MNRFKWWAMSVFSSSLVFMSLAYNFYENKLFGTNEIRILCLYTPTVILSVGGVLTSICCKGKKMKPWVETILILLNLVVWILIGIATLIGTGTSILQRFNELVVVESVKDQFNIGEPNIYFFSFGSLFNAVYLASSWFKQYILRDENALTTTQWMFLTTSGFLVMVTGSVLYDDGFCDKDNYSCARTLFSIFLGLISGIIGCILIPWRSAPLKCQAELALILSVTWGAAIAVLTFGTGPAVYINTMYLGAYLSFFLSLNIMTTTLYADSVLEASPYSQIEFGLTESQRDDELGAAGFLDMAYANITQSPSNAAQDDDPRRADMSTAMLFESVGGSCSSMRSYKDTNNNLSSSQVEREKKFNQKVIVGKRDFSRIEIWFLLVVESSVCVAVFQEQIDENRSLLEQWIILGPALSILLSFVGWFTNSIKKEYAYVIEGILIWACIILWSLGLIAVTAYFNNDMIDEDGTTKKQNMTANQLFMSYGSFFTSLYLMTHWSNASVTTTDWIFLTAVSATIFGILSIGYGFDHIFRKCDWHTDFQSCGELQLVTLLSLGSVCISFVMVIVSFFPCGPLTTPLFHIVIGTLLLSMWCAGSYFIVFDEEGVGAEIGPIFFACWGSLFFCVDVTTTNLVLLFKKRQSESDDDEVDDEVGSESSSQDEIESFGDEEENQITFSTNSQDVDTNDNDYKKVFEHHTEEDKKRSVKTDDIDVDG